MIQKGDQLKIKDLLELGAKGQLSEEQRRELLTLLDLYWINGESSSMPNNEISAIREFMRSSWHDSMQQEDSSEIHPVNWERMYQEITATDLRRMQHELKESRNTLKPRPSRFSFRWVAAAAIIILLGLSAWWGIRHNSIVNQTLIAASDTIEDLSAPSAARADTILADGRKISLDSSSSGLLATQAAASITLNGKNALNYQGSGVANNALVYNELRVRRGSQPVSVHLSDGSTVWLNVGSSLRFPTAFSSHERRVRLKGEGYFEVSKDKSRPFIVEDGALKVKVLGTHFNISSYPDDPSTKVTLLEGAVEVAKNKENIHIRPGQQVVTDKAPDGSLKLNERPNIEQVLSWRSEDFIFSPETQFQEIMRQIARWYDVELIYTGEVHTQFWGSLPRTASIKEVLQILEATGGVKFSLKDRQLKVIPTK